jgi:AbrB family looped-hinge helix DNA binding protein
MNATVEIDKLGRLVVPKKMRDALRLRAGDKLVIQCQNEVLKLERELKPRGLYEDGGWLVYDSGGPAISVEDGLRFLEDEREDRISYLAGSDLGGR